MTLSLLDNARGFSATGLYNCSRFLLGLALLLRGRCRRSRRDIIGLLLRLSFGLLCSRCDAPRLLIGFIHLGRAFLTNLFLISIDGFQALICLTYRLWQAAFQLVQLIQHCLTIHNAGIAAHKCTAAADNQLLQIADHADTLGNFGTTLSGRHGKCLLLVSTLFKKRLYLRINLFRDERTEVSSEMRQLTHY